MQRCCKKKIVERVRLVLAQDEATAQEFVDNRVSNTKYTLLTFLPLNLAEQFSRFMNVYFLLIACLQLWSAITPVNPATTWAPLCIIFAISAFKEALDDYYRAQSDKRANNRLYQVSKNGIPTQIHSCDIHVGDILYLLENDEVPADCVVLKTGNEGAAYVETANLDGETDLKPRHAIAPSQELTEEQIMRYRGACECLGPNNRIYEFDSQLKLTRDSAPLAINFEQTLLQGTILRNTTWAYGLVVFTGNETKVGMNKKAPPTKWTHLDKAIEKVTRFIFAFQIALIFIFGITGGVYRTNYGPSMTYLMEPPKGTKQAWYEPIVIPLRFMLLMSFMIPISLKVTLDLVKFLYAQLINWDRQMYDPVTDTPAEAKNTSLSEDLGQVEYIFSDKTGTLTENVMVFRKCSINRIVYGHGGQDASEAMTDPNLRHAIERNDFHVMEYIRCLALNQAVVPERDAAGIITYKSSSPDEEALVKAAANLGIRFVTREGSHLEVEVLGVTEGYELLALMEFSSDRKRSTVIVRNEKTNEHLMYSKGADDKMLPRLREDEDVATLRTHLLTFAHLGLRTLVIGRRVITQEEYKEFARRFYEASTALENRAQKCAAVYEDFERDFQLLGCTAIEDKLQEEVPETIALLRRAGIKIWMLTGDKLETAVQIGTSCNLLTPEPEGALLRVEGNAVDAVQDSVRRRLREAREMIARNMEISMIITGDNPPTLPLAMEHCKENFLELCLLMHSVICCRVTPSQKADVVRMIKEHDKVCLSIGDGGNDVIMIQEAHVGVGISGREGLQAARAADYSFAKFKFLKRLILIHGRYSYIRTAFIAQYCFYKSIYICLVQVLYNFFAAFSGVSFLNTFSLTLYNVVFTGLPVLGYALDKDVPEEMVLQYPAIFKDHHRNDQMNKRTMVTWFIRGAYHATISLLLTLAVFNVDNFRANDGQQTDYATLSMVTYTALVLVNQGVILLSSHHITVVNAVLLLGAPIAFFVSTAVYAAIQSLDFYLVMTRLYTDANYWWTVILITVVALVPDIFMRYLQFHYFPVFADGVQMLVHEARKNGSLLPRERVEYDRRL